ncbi:hypothetical protein UlMin_014901 [Ulmus minor]
MASMIPNESETRPHAYCRKEKSLGVLCCNFLRLYNRDDVKTIGLDDAALQLGVERRRMYDVVNILETLGVVARKAKNQYSWNGLGEIPATLDKLKEQGLRENSNLYGTCTAARVSNDSDYKGVLSLNAGEEEENSSKSKNKRDKSLALLTQNFIKLFLCSEEESILLENASKSLPGYADDATALRTKIRRLYDIANVLSSMNLIEKIRHPDSGKPAYRWLAGRAKPNSGSNTAHAPSEPKKRMFGTDITNYNSKRNRGVSAMDWKSNQEMILQMQDQFIEPEHECDGEDVKQHSKHSSNGIEFGPFAPTGLSKAENAANKEMRQVQDWEILASTYRPQYRNQALCDLYAHFTEAWKSWYGEATEKKQQTQQIC